jgi:solute carrier family 13 (sodium-dependent dicarboxylate transporter), member 2/3/5
MTDGHIVAADYVRGRLPLEEQRDAERHLNDCEECRSAVEAVKRSRDDERLPYQSKILVSFVARLMKGGATLLEAPLRSISYQPGPRQVDEEQERVWFEPLRVLTPKISRGAKGMARFVGRFGFVLLLTIGVLLIPRPEGLSAEGHRALAVFVFTGSILALEPVSLPIAALMVPVAQVALGVADTPQAFETFSRPVVFLILASLFLAEALRKHGLTRRLALTTIVGSGGGIPALVFGLMAIAALFSMWVENTATAAVLIPVALTIARQLPDPKKARQLLVLLVLGIAYAASVGGMATIMGSSSNAVAAGFLSQIRPWTFVDWMIYGVPSFILIFPLTWWILMRAVKSPVRSLDIEPVRKKLNDIGPMSGAEREILGTLFIGVVLWVGGSFIEPWLALPESLLSSAMVAVLIVSYLAVRGIIHWEDVKGVSWGIFLIIGAGLSLGEALSRTGATDWFAGLIVPLVIGPPLIVSMLLLVFLSALLTNLMNNTTIAAVFVPILISLAQSNQTFDPVELVLPVTLATTFGYSLPSASGRMSLIAASGIVKRSEMLRYGLLMTFASSTVLGLLFYLLAVLNWI